MAQISTARDSKSPQLLLRLLCGKITGLTDESLEPYYKMALMTLGSTIATPMESDEFEVAEKIKKKLVRQRRERDAAIFSELHRKLQGQSVIKNRWAVLYLLMKLSEDKNRPKMSQPTSFLHGLHNHVTSTPYVRSAPVVPHSFGRTPGPASTTHYSTDSSGISSIHGSTRSSEPTPVPQSLPSSYAQTPGMRLFEALGNRTQPTDSTMMSRPNRGISTVSRQRHRQTNKQADNTSYELPEFALVRELVYVFQGIEGRYIKYDATLDQFMVDQQVGVSSSARQTVNKLSEAGWLYNKVRKYADSRSTDRAFGQVGQSFCAALQEEMAEYVRLLGVLDAQLQQEEDLGLSMDLDSGMTLRKMRVWMFDPMARLRVLAALVDICQGKKGGALASSIHSYIQHADPSIRSLIKHKLTLVAEPIFTYIIRWMYGGQLEDTYHEFFVASDPTVKNDRLWREKYTLRKSMLPTFLTTPQAQKVLLTGKSINFLRQVCQDRTRIRNRDSVKAAETEQVESIFSEDLDGVFQNMIDVVCKETSLHLLDVLYNKYKFLDHLKAMRRYLLLGQGDFIRHLMDLLEEHLAKKADTLFLHNLSGILETAVRATNAQYDDVDILKRLDVRLLEVSPGDIGWDVFSLDYRVDGPIKTVFTPECMVKYLRIFNFLWRAKRMEYILAGIWKGQMGNARLLRSIPELGPVLHQCHMIASEMVHFVQQVQYYINFEVLECSWDELLKNVTEAEDLDCIVRAHENFLDTVIARSFIDQNSTNILAQLRTIFDLIISFQKIQDEMYTSATLELEERLAYIKNQEKKSKKNKWGLTQEVEDEEMIRRERFIEKAIPSTRSQLRVLLQSYQEMAQQLLVMLANYSDASLRFLSFRLDFNEYYRAKEPQLRSPLAYHKVKSRRP